MNIDLSSLHNTVISLVSTGACVWSGLMVFQVLMMRDSCNWRFDSIAEILDTVKKWLEPETPTRVAGLTEEGRQHQLIELMMSRISGLQLEKEDQDPCYLELVTALFKIEEIEKSYVEPHHAFLIGFGALAGNFVLLAVSGIFSSSDIHSNICQAIIACCLNLGLGSLYAIQTLRALRCY